MGVLAETPRTAAGRVLALGGAAVGCGALAIALAARVGTLATRPGVTRPDDLVELVVLGTGVLVLAWLAGSSWLAAACLVARRAGHVWRRGEGWVHRFAPTLVRRALVVVVAAGLGAASVGAASAADLPPTSPTATATASTAAGQIDLGWVVSTPGAAVPTPVRTSAPGADAPVEPSPTGPAPLQSPTGTPAGASPAAPARLQTSAPVTAPAPADAPSLEHGAAPRHAAAADALPMPHAAAPAAHRAARDEVATVVVLRGDTLWGIAARHLPPGASAAEVADAWPAWYAANAATIGPDPGLILPGQVLVAPAEVAR